MKLLVCISNVPDTTTKVKFVNNTELDKTGIQWIINPWDELALTRAIELKETSGGAIEKVTVITVGLNDSEPTIRKALAIGADDAIRIDANPKDAYSVAQLLSETIKINPYDIILCGIESCDYNGSMVGGMLAGFLNISSISAVSGITIENGITKVNREIDGGNETLVVTPPLVAIVQKGITKEPRIPSMRGIMQARTKPINVVAPTQNETTMLDYIKFELPQPKDKCKLIDPENPKELIRVLHEEAKVI